ncbi:MAG: methionine--tRNA ligase [Bacteroides sp.]
MNSTPKRYLITAALPYANGPLHIGHLAGVYVPADVYVRYLKECGRDVIWICGSDEHGVPITIRAQKEGCTPQQVVDKYHAIIKKSFEDFGIEFSIYSRTSNPTHYKTAQEFFLKLYEQGVFIEQESDQYYDPEVGQFLADRYITGTCPHCQNPNAYGDQCERCGTSLNATDLINPKSAISGAKPVLKKTKHWYLPLDKYQHFLEEWILKEHPEWKTNVVGQCRSWFDAGLHPRAVSRDLPWGVPVPLPNSEGKVLYVWFDAPIGYISATKELTPDWETYWKSPDTKMVHFIGKDNIVFHCIVFPSMLHAHGEFILPDNVPANEFLNLEGEKLSTSRNWAVWLHEYLEDFPGKQDALRYALMANLPETKDNDFTWKDFQSRNNSELVGILGNFFNRAIVLTEKYFDGAVPQKGALDAEEVEYLEQIVKQREAICEALESYRFRDALKEYMQLARLGNKYLADREPWKVIKSDKERVASIVYVSLQLAAALSVLGRPFLPFAAKKMAQMLQLPEIHWADLSTELLPSGHKLGKAELLFERIEDAAIEAQIERLRKNAEANAQQQNATVAPAKDDITFEQFEALDLRIGTVLEAERIPKTQKLLKLLVDTGIDKRIIVSGIAEYFTPETIIGKQVTVIVNLAPRKIKGVESHGMLLFAQSGDGVLHIMHPEGGAENGSKIS